MKSTNKIKKIILRLLFLIIFSIPVYTGIAQGGAKEPLSLFTNTPIPSFRVGHENLQQIGITGQHLRRYVSDCPNAVIEMKQYKKQVWLLRSFTFGTVLSAVGWGVGFIHARRQVEIDPNTGMVKYHGIGWTITRPVPMVSIACCIGFIYARRGPSRKNVKHLEKTIEEYNKWKK